MRYDNKFTDVTLVWEDGQLGEAHQVILAGWSPHTNTPTLSSGLDDSSSDDRKTKCRGLMGSIWFRKNGKLFTKLLLSVMYRLFHNRVYLVSEAWKIIHKVGSKTVLMQLFYYGQKDSVCRAAPSNVWKVQCCDVCINSWRCDHWQQTGLQFNLAPSPIFCKLHFYWFLAGGLLFGRARRCWQCCWQALMGPDHPSSLT